MTAAAMHPGVVPFASAGEQLAAELGWLELVLRRRAIDVAARRGSDERFDEFAGLYVSEGEIARYAGEDAPAAASAPDPRTAALLERIARLRAELDARTQATLRAGLEPRLQRLARRFRLSQPELRVLVCCLAPDWELRFQRYFAYLQNDVTRRRPTIQLLGELCSDDGEGARLVRLILSPDSPLLRERLLTVAQAELPFPARQPMVAESVGDFLAGVARPDSRLAGMVTIRRPGGEWPTGRWYERHRDIVARLERPLRRDGRMSTAYVSGVSGAGKGLVVNELAKRAGVSVLRADCRAWVTAGDCTRDTLRSFRRDAVLHGCLIQLARCEALAEPSAAAARAAIDEFLGENPVAGILLTGTAALDEMTTLLSVPLWGFELPKPDLGERADLWQLAFAARALQADAALVDSLSSSFRFTPRDMTRALDSYGAERSADATGDALPRPVDRELLVRSCRDTSRHAIHRFARRIVPRRSWEDLVVPEDSRQQLAEICAGARGRRRVHDEWGFERKLALGAGLNVLFAGPSGVGKTMSAEIVAGELGLDLFAVDLSCVVSKYIGETEKNLALVFDEAESTNCVLFFDECDALFGKRTEIKDAHDRYANIEVNYLLQRVDQYEGIVILATNLRSNLDAAFTRRIRYAVEFPFPEAQHREQIWRRVFPEETPVASDVDMEFLARQFKLTGGSIRNIAVNAAFLAASNGGRVGMKHLIHATRRELQKMGKSCTKTEFGRYFPWVRDAAPAGAPE
jgi:hypothetical protein